MASADEIVHFWTQEVDEKAWYMRDDGLDQTIRDRFQDTWQAAHDGQLDGWRDTAGGALGFMILTDQFSRNMFRDDPRAFATDARARACAAHALEKGFDMATPMPARQFFYMPFMHSEAPEDQARAVALFKERMCDEPGNGDTLHARVHQAIIQRFGRFPYRNAALGRISTPEEQDFIDNGGYAKILQSISDAETQG